MMNSTRPETFEECQNVCKMYPGCDFFTWKVLFLRYIQDTMQIFKLKEGIDDEWNKCWYWIVEYETRDGDFVSGLRDCTYILDATTVMPNVIPCNF